MPPLAVDLQRALVREAKRLEEDCTYSSRGHFEAARIWNFWSGSLGLPTTIAAAAAGANAFAENTLTATTLGVLAAAGSATLTFLKPGDRAARHLSAGNGYDAIRTEARAFHEIEALGNDDYAALRRDLTGLTERKNQRNAESPNPPRRAYKRARKRIERGEALHAVDTRPTYEIDEAPPEIPR